MSSHSGKRIFAVALAAALNAARAGHTAILLATAPDSGDVLLAGAKGNRGLLSSAELYDPAINSWSPTSGFTTARALHTATLLDSGQILAAGGVGPAGNLASAELCSP